ncbi:MAG: RNA methyltransferase [Candidatus Babeliaceae bacterium]|jgi:23S rRNA (guanosine2251-2'-O)-methyltransferase
MNKKTPQKIQEIIFGIHPVIELLTAKKRQLHAIYTTKPVPKSWSMIERLLPKNVQVNYVPRDALARMAQTVDHQGVVAYAGLLPIRKKFFDATKHPFLLMIDGVQDTRNLGAILRSAYCAGVDGVILVKKNSAPLNASTYKAAAGLSEHVDIYEAPSAIFAAQELKKAGYGLYLATLGGENAVAMPYQKPLCIVIGNEATGISSEILSLGQQVMLPQRRKDISYNASVAAGILLFLIGSHIKKI